MIRTLATAFAFITALTLGARAQEAWSPANGGIGYGYADEIVATPDGAVFIAAVSGLYRTTDRGVTWVRMAAEPGNYHRHLTAMRDGTVLVNDGDTLIVTTNGGRTWSTARSGGYLRDFIDAGSVIYGMVGWTLHASTDRGLSWSPVERDVDTLAHVRALASLSDGALLGVSDSLLVLSGDGGQSWSVVGLLPTPRVSSVESIVETRAGSLLLSWNGGVHRSTDRGITWTQVLSGWSPEMAMAGDGTLYAAMLGPEPGGVMRSSDDGVTWTRLLEAQTGPSAVGADGALYTSSYESGVVRSDDGTSWSSIGGALDHIYVSTLHAVANGDVLAGLGRSRSEIARSTDDGRSWSILNADLDGSATAIHVDAAGRIFAAVETHNDSSAIIVSLDDGVSWHTISENIPGSVAAFLETRTGVLYAGLREDGGFGTYGGALYRSLDGGLTWDRILDEPVWRLHETRDGAVLVSALYSTDHGPSRWKLFRSTDRGATWVDLFPDRYDRYEWSIGQDFESDADGVLYTSGGTSVFRSTDDGASWEERPLYEGGDPFWTAHVDEIAIDGIGNLYASVPYTSIYRSSDAGLTWTDWSSGFHGDHARRMITTTAGTVIAGTYWNGLFRASMPARTEGVQPTPASAASLSDDPTPNPATDGAMINVTVTSESMVSVSLRNLLGEEIQTLMSGPRRAGTYRVRVDTRDLASGLYLVTLETNGERSVRRLLVTKE